MAEGAKAAGLVGVCQILDVGVGIFSYLHSQDYLNIWAIVHAGNKEDQTLPDILQLEGVGTEIFSFLQPTDLSRLSRCSRPLHSCIVTVLFSVLSVFLPIRLTDTSTSDSICLTKGHSFETRSSLQSHLVEKINDAGINVVGASSGEESRRLAKKLLHTQSWCNLELPDNTHDALAECHFEQDIKPTYAKQIVGYDECKGVMENNAEKHAFMSEWLRFLLCQQSIRAGKWEWTANHPSNSLKAVRGMGIMISTGEGEKFEVRWERSFKVVDSVFTSNIHMRRRLTDQ